MKRIIRFSKFFTPAAVLSVLLIVAGLAGYAIKGGFNLGVDFQAGLIQEVQFAPTAFSLTWSGQGNATVSYDRNNMYIVLSGVGVEAATHTFSYAQYPAIGDLTRAFSQVQGLAVSNSASAGAATATLIQSARGNPLLGAEPYVVHYLPAGSEPILIEDVRNSLASLGTVSVQSLGVPSDRHFMIRMEDSELDGGTAVPAEKIISALEGSFGTGGVAVTRSDYVGSRFSKELSNQAGFLMALTLLLILAYASIRFKPQFAIGAVLAIAHDALIMVTFIAWTRMEFNTTTIAAILTILGYSINDTIVIFDRIRETRRIYPDDSFVDILDRALTETLSRTVITTVTTMLAVLSLFIFTTSEISRGGGTPVSIIKAIFTEHSSMKDFALALLVGMISGVYSTIFIASGFANFWDITAKKRAAKKRSMTATAPATAKA
ncbi:protein-export membrane protein SecF [Spirochaetia bacterium]|nr:protein-export membrane protein SecF [Spirochaetia bacterium]